MMIVDEVIWLCLDAKEAVLKITDNTYYCEGFCHPCFHKVGDVLSEPLESIDERNILRVTENLLYIEKCKNEFSHKILAHVINMNERLVKVGDILIKLSLPLPKDLKEGNKISFVSGRLDVL